MSEIEAERRLVEANRELIARMEKKIAATLGRIWGNDANSESYSTSTIGQAELAFAEDAP